MRHCLRALLIALLIFPTAAHAAPVTVVEPSVPLPNEEEARYRIYWNGVKLGKLWLHWKEDGEHYEAAIAIKTSGVARVFSKQDRGASVKGSMRRAGTLSLYLPERYEYHADGKRKKREIEIRYADTGAVTENKVTPPDDPKRRPPVPDAKRNAAYDPLTAIRAILHYAYTLSQGGVDSSSRFTVFDGRRLTGIQAVSGKGGRSCGEGCIVARGARALLDGYTDEEKEKFEESKEPPVIIEIYPAISRFPQKIHTDTAFGRVYAKRY